MKPAREPASSRHKALCILEKAPRNLARSPLHVALVGRKMTVVRDQLLLRRFVGDSAVHTSLRGAPLLVGEQKKWYQQILQKVQNLVPHDYIKSCTI